jgi:hypothetical protein
MVTQLIEQRIMRAQFRWQLAIGIVFTIGFIWWLYRQHSLQKLQMSWYAMAILQAKKETGIDLNSQQSVDEALKGDAIVDLANKLPIFGTKPS